MAVPSNLPQETRETVTPDQQGRVEFRREHSVGDGNLATAPLSLADFSIRAYSDASGGRAVRTPVIDAGANTGDPIQIDFTVYTGTADPGTDHLITYEVEDDNGNVTEFELFIQNGVWNPKDSANLLSRISSEFERLSGTFQDGDFTTRGVTDFEDFDLWTVPKFDLHFVSDSSSFAKHTDEQVPYYRAGNSESTLTAPDQLFSSRDGTIFAALQWDQLPSQDAPVMQVKQGDNVHMEIRNAQQDVAVESDFANATLYEKSTRAGEILLAELKIDTDPQVEEARGAVNREFDRGAIDIVGTFENGDTEVILNPEGLNADVKLFEFLVFPEAQSFEFSNRVASMFSYLYNVDMTEDSRLDTTTYAGSPDISNHLFYDERTDLFDFFLGFYGSNTPRLRKFDPDANVVWTADSAGEVLGIEPDNVGYTLVADAGSDAVTKLTKSGDEVWSFPNSDSDVTISGADLQALTLTSEDVAVGAFGTDVYGIDEAGQQAWLFGSLNETVVDVAATSEGRTYVASKKSDNGLEPVVVLLDSDGTEINDFRGHADGTSISSLVADSDGFAYSGAVNGEIRISNDSGNEEADDLKDLHDSGDEIQGLDVDDNYLYTASADGTSKKVNLDTLSEVWTLDFIDNTFIENQIDAIDSNDDNKPDPGDVSLFPINVAVDPNGNVYVIIDDSNDEIINHVFKVDPSGSVLWVEPYDNAVSVSTQPGLQASQWT